MLHVAVVRAQSELSISIQTHQGKADCERSRQEASRIQTLAAAEAEKIRILGEGEAKRIQAIAAADAERTARVGIAQAMAIEEQVRAYGGPRLPLTQRVLNRFAEAIQVSQVDVVPKILIASQGGEEGGSPMTGNVMEALLTLMMSERLGETPARSRAAECVGGRHSQTDQRRYEVGVGSTTDQNRGTPSEEGMRALVFVALVGAVTTASTRTAGTRPAPILGSGTPVARSAVGYGSRARRPRSANPNGGSIVTGRHAIT